MAKRRFYGSAKRRPTSWVSSDTMFNPNGINVPGGTLNDRLVYTNPFTEVVAGVAAGLGNDVTCVRIVGSVCTALQAAPAEMTPVYWGLYMAKSGGVGSYRLAPNVNTDMGEETWLHWRCIYHFIADDQVEWQDQNVDIRVKRVIKPGDELRFVAGAGGIAGFSVAASLRLLLMLP